MFINRLRSVFMWWNSSKMNKKSTISISPTALSFIWITIQHPSFLLWFSSFITSSFVTLKRKLTQKFICLCVLDKVSSIGIPEPFFIPYSHGSTKFNIQNSSSALRRTNNTPQITIKKITKTQLPLDEIVLQNFLY